MSPKEKLLAKFRKEPSLTKAALPKGKPALAALQELLAEGLVVKIGPRYFSDNQAPTQERELARIEAKLRGTVKLFKENALLFKPRLKLPSTRAALDELVDRRMVLRLEVDRDKKAGPLYLHSTHAGRTPAEPHPSEHSAPAPSGTGAATQTPSVAADSEPSSSPPDPGPAIRRAYAALRVRHGTDSVFISELADETGTGVPAVQGWLQKHAVEQGEGTLDEGDWSCATEEQRAAAMMLRDRRRLYIRLHS